VAYTCIKCRGGGGLRKLVVLVVAMTGGGRGGSAGLDDEVGNGDSNCVTVAGRWSSCLTTLIFFNIITNYSRY
jgi:hypothetical protein